MLWDPAKFEPLTDRPWDEAWVREQIREIVADADAAYFDETALWPADEWDAWQTPTPLKALYVGAAGVVWALDALRRRGHAESRLDLVGRGSADAGGVARRAGPDARDRAAGSGPGRAPLRSERHPRRRVAARLRRTSSPTSCTSACSRTSTTTPSRSCGARPGRCSRPARCSTGRARSAGRRRGARARRGCSSAGTRTACGRSSSTAAPPGGSGRRTASSATCSRCSAAATCSPPRRERRWSATRPPCSRARLSSRTVASTGPTRTAWGSSGRARSGCSGAAAPRGSSRPRRHTSTRICCSPPRRRSGGRARTAPTKGANICHGTAGNGYALLKTFERTGNELWLDRARRFAVHALEQAKRARTERGHGRYSLWTGDAGVAVYAADCLDVRTRYPVLETWD